MPAARARATAEARIERMELRVRPSAKRTIRRATALTGLSAADLAYRAACQAIAEHDRIVLAGADRDAFLDLILRPPAASARLARAFRRHRQSTR